MKELVTITEIARRLATEAHAGQVDRAGFPAIDHPTRVARYVEGCGEVFVAAAYLHDTLEDTTLTPQHMLRAGLPLVVIQTVQALTRHFFGQETYRDFVRRSAAHPIARVVKFYDICDHYVRPKPTDPAEFAATEGMLRTRYPKAIDILLGMS